LPTPQTDNQPFPAAEERRPLAANAAWRFAAALLRIAVGLVSVSLFTRILGMSQWGLLALFQAAVAPLALIDGLGRATVKYVAESLGRGDARAAAGVARTALALNLGFGAIGTVGLLLAAPWMAASLFAIPPADVDRATLGFRVTAATWLLGIVTTTYSAVLAARQRYDATARLSTLSVVLSTASGLVLAATTRDVVFVMMAQTVTAAVMAILYIAAARRALPEAAGPPRVDSTSLRRMLGFWRWEVVGVAGGLLGGWSDRYILGAFLGPVTVGFYVVANILQTQLYALFLEAGEVLFPAVSHLEGRGELTAARRLALLVGWTLTSTYGAAAAVLAIIGGDFIHLWVSAEAAQAVTPTLRILCVSSILALTAVAPLYYTLGIGRTRWGAASGVLIGVTVVIVGLVLIPRFGLLGVGFGLLAGTFMRCFIVLLVWRVHFRHEVGVGPFAAQTWAPAAVAIATIAALSSVHDALRITPGWPAMIGEAIVFLLLAAGIQLAVAASLPGGRQRLRDVVGSFRPILASLRGTLLSSPDR
jgi:O-antigen/teichoic acid export membrane protein